MFVVEKFRQCKKGKKEKEKSPYFHYSEITSATF